MARMRERRKGIAGADFCMPPRSAVARLFSSVARTPDTPATLPARSAKNQRAQPRPSRPRLGFCPRSRKDRFSGASAIIRPNGPFQLSPGTRLPQHELATAYSFGNGHRLDNPGREALCPAALVRSCSNRGTPRIKIWASRRYRVRVSRSRHGGAGGADKFDGIVQAPQGSAFNGEARRGIVRQPHDRSSRSRRRHSRSQPRPFDHRRRHSRERDAQQADRRDRVDRREDGCRNRACR